MPTNFILASTAHTLSSETLFVETDSLSPIKVASVTLSSDPHATTENIMNVSVSSNSDGTFDVFWTDALFNGSSGAASYSVHEQAYSASRKLVGPELTIAHGTTFPLQAGSDATATADGGYVLASTAHTLSSETLFVETNSLFLIKVASVTLSSDPRATTENIMKVSVSSNSDGTFDVFWTDALFNGSSGLHHIVLTNRHICERETRWA